MGFALKTTGTYPIPNDRPEDLLLADVARALAAYGAENVATQAGVLEFDVPWRVTHGPLWSIDGGSVRVVNAPGRRHFRYELSRRRSALSVALISYGWLGGLSVVALHQSIWFALGLGTAAFLFLFTLGTAVFSSFERVLPFQQSVPGAV